MDWQKKAKIATWSLVAMFLFLMIPFERIYQNFEKQNQQEALVNSQALTIFSHINDEITKAKSASEKENYDYLDYAGSVKTLRDLQYKLDIISDEKHEAVADGLSKQIDTTVMTCLTQLKTIKGDGAIFTRNLNQAFESTGMYQRLPDGTLISAFLTIVKWYLIFAVFAFFIFCFRMYYSPNFSLKEELILGLPRMLLFAFFWPFGLETFPNEERTAKENKVQKALGKLAGKLNYNWRKIELFRDQVTQEVCAPIRKVDRAIEKVENLPQAAKEKGRWATVFTSLLATLLSPIVTKADELMQFILTGAGTGNSLVFKYNHNEQWWQTNCSFTDKGSNIQALAGPNFKIWKMIVKPEVGAVITTQEKLAVDAGIVGVNAVMPATLGWNWNAWSLNKYIINFKDKLLHLYIFDQAVHYMLAKLGLESLGFGAGLNGTYAPFVVNDNFNANLGPRLFWKTSKSISIEVAMGLNLKTWQPAMFRLLAFVPF